MTINTLNEIEPEKFVHLLGGVYEHSPWVAQAALHDRPFENLESLLNTLREVVNSATDEQKRTLLLAHPDLAGKLAVVGKLTTQSASEQCRLGLDRLPETAFQQFTTLNKNYRNKFGIPFIICVRNVPDVEHLLATFRKRLELPKEDEFTTALNEVHNIAELRTRDCLE